MSSSKKKRHVFIIRIWLEPREREGVLPQWRGVIEAVNSGQRRFLKNLDEINDFILPYLDEMGVRPELRQRLKHWLPWKK